MVLYLFNPFEKGFSLFECYGLFKIGEKDIAKHVNDRKRFRKIVDLVAFYQFESSEAQTEIEAFSKGHVTPKLQSFLLSNLPENKPEFSLGVATPKLGSKIFRATNISCLCDSVVLELIRGVQLHIAALTQLPESCSLDEDHTKAPAKKMKTAEGVPLLKYKFFGCMVEDLKKGKTTERAATLKDMVSIHYTVTRMKDDRLLLDTNTLQDPVKFCLGTGQVILALDVGICGMFVGGERRFVVPVSMGYETKSGRGTKNVRGPEGASGHRLVIDVRLIAIDF